jgi:hypothetical protein
MKFLNTAFLATKESLQLLMLHVYMRKTARPPWDITKPSEKIIGEVGDRYDHSLYNPSDKIFARLGDQIQRILEVNSWSDFFRMIETPCPPKGALCKRLRKSIRYSLTKLMFVNVFHKTGKNCGCRKCWVFGIVAVRYFEELGSFFKVSRDLRFTPEIQNNSSLF